MSVIHVCELMSNETLLVSSLCYQIWYEKYLSMQIVNGRHRQATFVLPLSTGPAVEYAGLSIGWRRSIAIVARERMHYGKLHSEDIHYVKMSHSFGWKYILYVWSKANSESRMLSKWFENKCNCIICIHFVFFFLHMYT